MSRIGKSPITVPNGVEVSIAGRTVSVKGPKGNLSREIPGEIIVRKEENSLLVERPNDERNNRALHGLTRTLVNNMVVGVTQGFEKKLTLLGVGFKAQASGNKLNLVVGYSHPVNVEMPSGISVATPSPTEIVIKGADRQRAAGTDGDFGVRFDRLAVDPRPIGAAQIADQDRPVFDLDQTMSTADQSRGDPQIAFGAATDERLRPQANLFRRRVCAGYDQTNVHGLIITPPAAIATEFPPILVHNFFAIAT